MVANPVMVETETETVSASPVLERTLEKSAPLRKAFVEREPQPTLEELAKEFKVSKSTVNYWSATQNWTSLRSEFVQTRQAAQNAVALASQRASPTVALIEGALVNLVQGVIRTMQDIDHERAAGSRATIYNTCAFALKNASDSAKAIGLSGMTKALKEVSETSGGWTPQLTQQINVILSQQSAEKSIPAPANPPQPDETPLG